MKDIFKNWKSLGIGGAIGAVATVLIGVGVKVVKGIHDNKELVDSIESYEDIPSNEETQSEE